MTRDKELKAFFLNQSKNPRFAKVIEQRPPLTKLQSQRLAANALKILNCELAFEYLTLLQFANGGGYTHSFISSETSTVKILNRQKVRKGIIDENLELRQQEIISDNEVVYAIGDGCIFYPDPKTRRWLGRECIKGEIYFEFDSFEVFFQNTYDIK